MEQRSLRGPVKYGAVILARVGETWSSRDRSDTYQDVAGSVWHRWSLASSCVQLLDVHDPVVRLGINALFCSLPGTCGQIAACPCCEQTVAWGLRTNWVRTNHHSGSGDHHSQRAIICWADGRSCAGRQSFGLWMGRAAAVHLSGPGGDREE